MVSVHTGSMKYRQPSNPILQSYPNPLTYVFPSMQIMLTYNPLRPPPPPPQTLTGCAPRSRNGAGLAKPPGRRMSCNTTPPLSLPGRGWGDSGSSGCVGHFGPSYSNSLYDGSQGVHSSLSGGSRGSLSSGVSSGYGDGDEGPIRFRLEDGFSSAEEETWGSEGEVRLLCCCLCAWCYVARACVAVVVVVVVVVVVLCLSMCGVGPVLGWPGFGLRLCGGMLMPRCTRAVLHYGGPQ